MKVKLIVSSIILGFAVSCNDLSQVNLAGQNLALDYSNTAGVIQGNMNFDIDGQKWSDTEVQIRYDESLSQIDLVGSTQSASVDAPEWWAPLKSVNSSGVALDIQVNNPKTFVMRSGDLQYGEDQYGLSGLNLNCKTPTAILRPLENCLQTGSLKISSFQMAQANALLQTLSSIGTEGTNASFKNLVLTFKNGSFDLELKASLSVSVNVKGEGKVEYLPKGQDFDLKIKIDKLKASFLNIRDDLFKELKKSESEKLKIQEPYIYIAF